MLTLLSGFFGTAIVVVVGWLFTLGNRVSIVETKDTDLEKLINTRFDEVNRRLQRIETGMNGFLSNN